MPIIENQLRTPSRYITTHDAAGKAVFSDAFPPELQWQHLGNEASFSLAYCTNTFPPDLSTPPADPDCRPAAPQADSSTDTAAPDATTNPSPAAASSATPTPGLARDLSVYGSYLAAPPGLVISGGSVLRYVDLAPSQMAAPDRASLMHRTLSLDYGIVLEGEVELALDSGETRRLNRGDVAVQRATFHAWRNPSPTDWARMIFVLIPCLPLEVAGHPVEEHLGEIKGIRASD